MIPLNLLGADALLAVLVITVVLIVLLRATDRVARAFVERTCKEALSQADARPIENPSSRGAGNRSSQ